jgi:hypothetical protein
LNKSLSFILVVGLAAFCLECGSSSPAAPTPTPTPPPPPVTIAQGTLSLPAAHFERYGIATSGTGTLTVTVNWTFASDVLWVGVATSACTVPAYQGGTCAFLAFDQTTVSTPSKTVTVAGLAPGSYTVIIDNRGPKNESLNYLFRLAPS